MRHGHDRLWYRLHDRWHRDVSRFPRRYEWDALDALEEHRRDVEEYLADLSEHIRRLREARAEASPTAPSAGTEG